MSKKLYIFGIGGTGSRVMKSLTMLLAAGVEIDAEEIIPIIIDPDYAAADLTRTVEIMRAYCDIRESLRFDATSQNKFFKARINMDMLPNATLPLQGANDDTFGDYIGYSDLHDPNKALASMLFSKSNLSTRMNVGFKGNPNIGSVVLNQFPNSIEFQNIINTFEDGDRVFVISSIFGGTGASGFPLLVKNLRAVDRTIGGHKVVQEAPIGAITVLPYFRVSAPEPGKVSEIDSSTFISKTKAALEYYNKNVNEPNVLYYVADKIANQYRNVEGGTEQKNAAHIIELISALAIVDFMNIPDNQLNCKDGKPIRNIYKEYGTKRNEAPETLVFGDLSDQTNKLIKKKLTQFVLFNKFMSEHMDNSINSQPWAKDLHYDENYLNSSFYGSLSSLHDRMFEWLKEMAQNKRAFAPYELEENEQELFKFVNGVSSRKLWWRFDSNYALFDSYLNGKAKGFSVKTGGSENQNFVELFYQVTQKLVEDKLNMK